MTFLSRIFITLIIFQLFGSIHFITASSLSLFEQEQNGPDSLSLFQQDHDKPDSLYLFGPDYAESDTNDVSRVYFRLDGYKGFGVREFNRVDGLALSWGLTVGGTYADTDPQLNASIIYYTHRERVGWSTHLHKSFQRWGYLTTGIRYYRMTDTFDSWRMGDLESSLASFVLKESFRDYYEKEGASFYLTSEVSDLVTLTASYTLEHQRSVENENPFAIPGDSKEFRDNPGIDEGRFSAVSFSITYDSRDNIRLPHAGWYHEGVVEISRNWMSSDFSFVRWFAHLRKYQPLKFNHYLNLRLAVAGSIDELPDQRLFTAGGVGTLRGYPDLVLRGDHMLLTSAEYRFPIGLLKLKPMLVVFNELHGMLFFDMGKVWFKDKQDNAELLADAGVGLSGANFLSYFGLYLAWPLRDGKGEPRLTIKIQRDF